jgi:alpha-maltose-1-phosphate synthase
MRISILTNEYPPHVYGGAGVHVEYLTRELARADNGSTRSRCAASAITTSGRAT